MRHALAGLRVLDFTWVWAGPYCTWLLAHHGAEVIRVETRKRPDLTRLIGPWPDGEVGDLEKSGYFHKVNRSKKSLTLNLKKPEAVEIAKRLVAVSDVVAENFSPRVMTSLGLGYETLRAIKPDLIMVSMSGYGATGPERDFIMYGQMIEGLSGLMEITGYPDDPPMKTGVYYGDPMSGLFGALATVAALRHRDRTGEGQHIDVSQLEATTALVAWPVFEYVMNGRIPEKLGNRSTYWVPQGCYPCRGEDEWVVICVETEEEWGNLCRVLGRDDLLEDPRFADRQNRFRHQDELDEVIAAWTCRRDSYEAMHLLQKAGVPAGAVPAISRLISDPHLQERGFYEAVDHPRVGGKVFPTPGARLSATPGGVRRHAPLLGQDTEAVLSNLLEMSPEEIQRLREAEVLY